MSPRGQAVLAGVAWLCLGAPLLALAAISMLVGSQSAILFAVMAIGALVLATALFLRPADRRWLIASALVGVVFAAIAGLASTRSEGVFPSLLPTLAYAGLAAATAAISWRAASGASR